ncbi:MAG: hypothetical protein HYR97_00050 [Candidatus Melainabacteria bacterium]|nr:hypothetical protein [Candidatus Melainabacteria bacterium]
MKKSLELLLATKKEAIPEVTKGPTDDEVLKKAGQINDLESKKSYLKEVCNNTPKILFRSTVYLFNLLKKNSPQEAYEVAENFSYRLVDYPDPYLLIGEMAIENKAWAVAKSVLEIAKWFSFGKHSDTCKKANRLLDVAVKELAGKKNDNSLSEQWRNKIIDKAIVLLMLQNALPEDVFYDYSVRLLNLYPDDIENYDRVYQLLYLIEDKQVIEKFIRFLDEVKHLESKHKNLYAGISYYNLRETSSSIQYLEQVLTIEPDNLNAKFYLALNSFRNGNMNHFLELFSSILPVSGFSEWESKGIIRDSAPIFIAALFLYGAASGEGAKEVKLQNEKSISLQMAKLINEAIELGDNKEVAEELIDKLEKFKYCLLLPSVKLYLAEFYIRKGELSKAKELLKTTLDPEVNRLNSWIYRLENKKEKAEEELMNYRTKRNCNEHKASILKIISLKIPKQIPESTEEVLKTVQDAYKQVYDLKQDIALEYGIETDTCFETGCNDCCKKTFPIISYTEYLYLRNWLDKQPDELKEQVYENSRKIVNLYKERYKKDPLFLSAEEANSELRHKYYPKDFKFDCPALVPQGCSVYDAQPFICRSYGYANSSGNSFNGCSFYYEQLKMATGLTSVRKIIDGFSFMRFAVKADEKLLGKSVYAPIPVWFADDHEKTVWKASGYRLSRGLFSPIFAQMTKLYFKSLDVKRQRDVVKNK